MPRTPQTRSTLAACADFTRAGGASAADAPIVSASSDSATTVPSPTRRRLCAGLPLAVLGAMGAIAPGLTGHAQAQTNIVTGDGTPVRSADIPFVVTPNDTVRAMLDLAEVKADDVVYDLGCGDGRIVIAAAALRGARGVGVEIDDKLVELARVDAKRAGVESRVRIEQGDLFAMDFKDATVVMLYLSEQINMRLWPKFVAELKPGARIVSHKFPMGERKPERTVQAGVNPIYLWRTPKPGDKQ